MLTPSGVEQAAWGRLQKGGTQLFISNFEIGIVLKHPYASADREASASAMGPPWESNLPFMIPPPSYTEETQPFLTDKYFSST